MESEKVGSVSSVETPEVNLSVSKAVLPEENRWRLQKKGFRQREKMSRERRDYSLKKNVFYA